MSNLSAIGFTAPTEEALESVLVDALAQAEQPKELGESSKRHVLYSDPSGAAMAAHLGESDIQCITPFFVAPDGGTTWRVRSSSPHVDRACNDCSGADCDILDSSEEMVTRSCVQWLYFDVYADWLKQERTYDLQVVGFASAFRLCETEEQWQAAQADAFGSDGAESEAGGKPMRLADEAFLPHGMFENEGDLRSRARALITGKVEKLNHPANQLTGERFTWARIHTMCGQLDIVAPFEAQTRHTPGMRLLADAWLVGRPVDPPPPKKRGWWLKLIGR